MLLSIKLIFSFMQSIMNVVQVDTRH